MSAAGNALRNSLRLACRVVGLFQLVLMPWLLLLIRIWLGQSLFVHQIMMMAMSSLPVPLRASASPGFLGDGASGWAMALLSLGSILLMIGLLTRPVALALLLQITLSLLAGAQLGDAGPRAALLLWLVAAGAGPLSLDGLLTRGFSWGGFGWTSVASRLYRLLTRFLTPLIQLAVRLGIAASITAALPAAVLWRHGAGPFGHAMQVALPAGWLLAIALALVLGLATRAAAFVVVLMIPLNEIAMSMNGRLTILLLLLTTVIAGAGPLAVDYLLVRLAWATRKIDGAAKREPHVVIVGGGFGGVAAAQGLRDAPCKVTLIDRRNHHLFQPLLYQVATAALSPADIATPIRSLFRLQKNVCVSLAEVTGVDTATKEVLLGAARVKFDYLVLATGARHSYFGKDQWADFAPGLKNVEDATAIRSRLLLAFEEAENAAEDEERDAWLTFVVVGGGPTGVELAGAIAELARHGMDMEYRTINPASARVVLVQSGPRILPTFAPALSAAAARALTGLGVEIQVEARVGKVDEAGVTIGERRLPARTVLWAAGVTASPAAQWLDRPADKSGRLVVNADLSVPDLPGAYALGDTAASLAWQGKPVPGLAPAAKQAGHYVARVIRAELDGGRGVGPFRYRHFGNLATIGRQAAVAELGPIRLRGGLAWWFWGAAHIGFLVGGRNKATVILDWFWAYITYRRSTRLITGDTTPSQRQGQ